MMRSLWTAASGMRAQQINVDTIANNMANINTVGYKKEEASFKSLLYQNLQSTSTNNAGENKPVAAEVGLGARMAAITTTFSQGAFANSSNPFSMALEGKGFFHVKNGKGEDLYTRDGSFIVSPVGNGNMLCSSDGYPVMDQRGNPIIIPLDVVASEITVNSETGGLLAPNKEGVMEQLNNGQYDIHLGIYQFNNPSGLSKAGANNYSITVASGQPIQEFGNNEIQKTKVFQGYLESSNVDVADEIVNLIVAQRAYEMNSKAIKASDDMMQQANNLRG